MPSLTPLAHKDEVAQQAFYEGLTNGFFTLVPTAGALYIALKQSPRFRSVTNWQSRTALVIMPALFVFGFTSEEKVVHQMKEMARANQHSHDSVKWAERQLTKKSQQQHEDQQKELGDLYRRAIYESGVRVVPELKFHHIASNYVAENPFKVLATIAVPGVAWIFYGRSGQEHLTFSMKVMHTRVFGQFATISALLGVMGFKEYVDRHGRFISQNQAEARVEEMKELRTEMLARLEAKNEAQEAYNKEIRKAHEKDEQEGNISSGKKHKKKDHHHRKNNRQEEHHEGSSATVQATSPDN